MGADHPARKSVSKRIRFEVFKRDGFRCAYCGRQPPAVVLEVDHVEPVRDGGDDDITNLITACFDCNRGKSHVPLETVPAPMRENLEILQERELQIAEYRKFVEQVKERAAADMLEVESVFRKAFPKQCFTEFFKEMTLRRFLDALPQDQILDAMRIACSRIQDTPEHAIKYFCGICWNRIYPKRRW